MLRGFLYLTFLFSALSGFSQIVLKNSSWENGKEDCTNTVSLDGWVVCEIGVANCKIDTIPQARPDSAVSGRFVAEVAAGYGGSPYIGSFSQETPCLFSNEITYLFEVYLAAYIPTNNPIEFPYFSRGKVEIWLGSDSCSYEEQIFLSPLLDSVWEKFSIKFKPNQSYNNFFFRGHPPLGGQVLSTLMIDALSPIYVVNAHELEAVEQDSLFYEKKQQCISLSATASATMDSVWWEQVGVGIISQQLNAGVVCVDSNATFIVHGIGTDSTCAGYLPSSDTVRVRFYDPTSWQPEVVQKTMFKVYPNPAKDYFTIEAEQTGTFQLFNSLGQLVLTKEINQGSNTTLDVSGFSSGVYYYNFLSDGNADARGKLVKE